MAQRQEVLPRKFFGGNAFEQSYAISVENVAFSGDRKVILGCIFGEQNSKRAH